MALFRNIKNLKYSFILFFLPFSTLNADVIKKNNTSNENRNFNLNIGLGIINTPKYEGSNKSIIRTVPFIDLKFKKFTFNPITGLRVNFINNENWSLDYGLGLNLGRDPKLDSNLSGLKKINWTLEPKVITKYKSKYYSISSEIAYDLLQKGHKGSYLKTSLISGFPIINLNTFLIPSVSLTYANKTYLNNFFGIDTDDNIKSGYSVYNLSDGIKDITANIIGIYKLNEKINFTGNISYKILVGQSAKSPVVFKKDNITAVFTVSYTY